MELVIIFFSEMEFLKDTFSNVLKELNLGYAEPRNPKFDLNGQDALSKGKNLCQPWHSKKNLERQMFNEWY